MKKLIMITSFSLLALNAFADEGKKPENPQTAKLPTFSLLDANSDGFISADESKHLSGLEAQFAKLDADGDKRLSRAEFLKFKIQK